MTQAFTRQLRKAPKYSRRHLYSLLICYRYFKECRNVFMHASGVADSRLAEVSNELAGLSATDLGTRSVPEHLVFAIGDLVRVSPRSAVGLSDVLLRVVTTLDADLSCSLEAERHFLARWRRMHRARRYMATEPAKRTRQVVSRTTRLGLPVPAATESLDALLTTEGLVF
jgi:hypothetical protein